MAVKIYSSGGAIVIEGFYTEPLFINPSNFDWQLNNGFYSVRDNIEKQSYNLGELSDIQNKDGVTYTDADVLFTDLCSLTNFTNISQNEVNKPLNFDAWGRNKVYIDRSIVHGMFTESVPVGMWKEIYNEVEQTPTIATSVNGALSMKAGATLNDDNILRTFRNPRYEPNRGHLYSTACILPDLTALGVREFGIFTEFAGCFFRLKSDGKLYAVIRTTVNDVVIEDEQLIDTTGIDLSKGNVYDIQFQWRGVGNYAFFINLKQVYKFNYLGTLTRLSIYNPALPISYRCVNLGNNVEIISGCVDVSSEGGSINGKTYGSVSIENEVGQIAVSGFNTPVLAIRSKKTINSKQNTRDTLALLLSAYADQRSFIRVWATRDFTAITDNNQVWKDFGDGYLEYVEHDNPDVATPITFNTSKATLIFGCRVNADETYSTSALFEGRTDIWLTPGDMFIFTMHRENGLAVNCGCTFEFAEEI